jgi:3-methyladenine DNA glycosylase/8-oxoguanine DNA glycosylase
MTGHQVGYWFLAATDPVFSRLAGVYGHPDPFEWFDGGRTGASLFAAMVLHITGQRISAAAAFTVFDRIAEASGGIPGPDALLALGTGRLRALGLSGTKAACLLELARRQAAGLVDLENMGALSDGEVTAALTDIPGIGLWSAQAFLLRQLRRPDVLPAEDTGIRRAIGREWHLGSPPTSRQARERAVAWTPYRSYAAALLWRSLRPPGEPSDPKARALAKAGRAARPLPGQRPQQDAR